MLTCKCAACKERHEGCHADCKDYADYKARLKEINDKRREAQMIDGTEMNLRKQMRKSKATGKRTLHKKGDMRWTE